MRYPRSCIPIMLLLLFPSLAPALDLFGQSRTYLTTREKGDATRQTQLYEYLNFSLANNDGTNVGFNFGGWYRHDMASEGPDSTDNDDLQYAYLSLKRGTGNGMLNLGRVIGIRISLNSLPADEQPVASKLNSLINDVQLSQTFQWELETKLMDAAQKKTKPA